MEQPIVCSVVVPVYNEEAIIEKTYRRLKMTMEALGEPYELLFVNDGSRDGTQARLTEISRHDRRVKFLTLSRNFGHQYAISAGIDYAQGQAVVTIDGDLQDPPELIATMLEQWRQGYEIVFARRSARRGESWIKRTTASLFYRFLQRLTEVNIPEDVGDFRLMDRRVVEVLRAMPEQHRFVRGMVGWAGFHQSVVEYARDAREAGGSKYSWKKMLRLATDGILSFSHQPVTAISILGVVLVLFGMGGLVAGAFLRHPMPMWLSSVMVTCTGLVLSALGVVGAYVVRIYDEARRRPLYVVAGGEGFDAHEETLNAHEGQPPRTLATHSPREHVSI